MIELIGLLLPPFIDIINRKIKDSDVRFVISVIFCSIVGLVLNFLTNGNHFGDQTSIAKSILTVFGSAQLSFKMVWDDSRARGAILKNSGTES